VSPPINTTGSFDLSSNQARINLFGTNEPENETPEEPDDFLFKKPLAPSRPKPVKTRTGRSASAVFTREKPPIDATLCPKAPNSNPLKRKIVSPIHHNRTLQSTDRQHVQTSSAVEDLTHLPSSTLLQATQQRNEGEGSLSPYQSPVKTKVKIDNHSKGYVAVSKPKHQEQHTQVGSGLPPRRLTHSACTLPTTKKAHVLHLPVADASADVNLISVDTMIRLVRGEFNDYYKKVVIVDCRFSYEYEGGHIKGAINLGTVGAIEQNFMISPSPLKERLCIVFHCEFSSHRGPTLFRYLRSWDREVHAHCYPDLYYPEMYILEGGYKKFFEASSENKIYCNPPAYISMNDSRFVQQMKTGLSSVRNLNSKNKVWRSRSWSVELPAAPGAQPRKAIDWSCVQGGSVDNQSGPSTTTLNPQRNYLGERDKENICPDKDLAFLFDSPEPVVKSAGPQPTFKPTFKQPLPLFSKAKVRNTVVYNNSTGEQERVASCSSFVALSHLLGGLEQDEVANIQNEHRNEFVEEDIVLGRRPQASPGRAQRRHTLHASDSSFLIRRIK
jgi:hypothetical protein